MNAGREIAILMIPKCFVPKYWRGLVDQSHLTLCDPVDCSLPGSSVHGILRQEYWNRLPFPTLGDLPDPGIEPGSLALQAGSL